MYCIAASLGVPWSGRYITVRQWNNLPNTLYNKGEYLGPGIQTDTHSVFRGPSATAPTPARTEDLHMGHGTIVGVRGDCLILEEDERLSSKSGTGESIEIGFWVPYLRRM